MEGYNGIAQRNYLINRLLNTQINWDLSRIAPTVIIQRLSEVNCMKELYET
jgi:hypothetical protein